MSASATKNGDDREDIRRARQRVESIRAELEEIQRTLERKKESLLDAEEEGEGERIFRSIQNNPTAYVRDGSRLKRTIAELIVNQRKKSEDLTDAERELRDLTQTRDITLAKALFEIKSMFEKMEKRIGALEKSLLIAPAKRCKNAGFSAKQCKEAGHSIQQIINAGYTCSSMRDAGFTFRQCYALGFVRKDFPPRDLPTLKALDKELYDECNNSSHYGGRPIEVERLVKLGANGSGYKDPSNSGWTALMYAAYNNKAKCVKLMLSTMSKDEAAVQTKDGDTALSLAARNGRAECVELLLQHMDRRGVMLKTWLGQTAKEWAQEQGKTQCVALFTKYGY